MEFSLPAYWSRFVPAVVFAGAAGMIAPANATTILTFGQTSNARTIVATVNAAHTATHIGGTDIGVLISQYSGGGAPFNAFLNVDLDSTGPATLTAGQVLQPFAGDVTFTSLAGGLGINYLSVAFTDFVFGTDSGSSLTLSASQPPGSVTYTSDILDTALLDVPRALSFAFADVTLPARILGTTLRGFSSSVSGTVSANVGPTETPEPMSLSLLGVGLIGLAVAKRRFGGKQVAAAPAVAAA